MFKRLLLASALVLPVQAQAADIRWWSSSSTPNKYDMEISGKIDAGDYGKFMRTLQSMKVNQSSVVTVHLNSPGGFFDDGLAIGKTVRDRGFETFVADNSVCASMCALIWIGGQRLRGLRAQIGFHCVYFSDNLQCSPSGNAMAGAYLGGLGFNDDAITFMTHALPKEKLEYLTLAKAKQYGISMLTCVNGRCRD